jgi:hypothetical protein
LCAFSSSGVAVIYQAVMRPPGRSKYDELFLKFGCKYVDGYMRRMGDISQPTLPNFG